VSASATSTEDVGLIVYQVGQKVAIADRTTSGTETVSFPTVAGRRYVVNLVGFAAGAGQLRGGHELHEPVTPPPVPQPQERS